MARNNHIEHAKRELALANVEHKEAEKLMEIITIFKNMNHSGASADWFVDILDKLLRMQPLTPLTNDPEDWVYVAGIKEGLDRDVYQNARDSNAFSHDGGKTYYYSGYPRTEYNSVDSNS